MLANQVREALMGAGYREATDLPARAAFRLSWSAALTRDRPDAAGVTVSLELNEDTGRRRAVFAGYTTALILGGFHVDYRGHYLYVHNPRGT
jgi:hypothetical protein